MFFVAFCVLRFASKLKVSNDNDHDSVTETARPKDLHQKVLCFRPSAIRMRYAARLFYSVPASLFHPIIMQIADDQQHNREF